jgi:hypothetical protein
MAYGATSGMITVLANRRWSVISPSRYRLVRPGKPIDLVFDGADWHLTDGKTTIAVPDTYTGAMMLHKRLNALDDPDDLDFTLEHLTRPL